MTKFFYPKQTAAVLRALDFSFGQDAIKLFIILPKGLVTVWTSSLQILVVADDTGIPIGTSNHYVSAIISTEHVVPDMSFSCKIYLKSQAD